MKLKIYYILILCLSSLGTESLHKGELFLYPNTSHFKSLSTPPQNNSHQDFVTYINHNLYPSPNLNGGLTLAKDPKPQPRWKSSQGTIPCNA